MLVYFMKKMIYIFYVFLLAVFVICLQGNIRQNVLLEATLDSGFDNDLFREFNVEYGFYEKCYDFARENEISVAEVLTTNMIYNSYEAPDTLLDTKDFYRIRNRLVRINNERYAQIYNVYRSIYSDIKYFPVAASTTDRYSISFENSWAQQRTYGGERIHEGCDIIPSVNERGLYPVISVCDGTVTNIGWLELGGYRVGITSDNGIYYYYAHLSEYSDIALGQTVHAGQVLGYMGDSGYSQIEGTVGNFCVHLHFGIYLNEPSEEIAINPYHILCAVRERLLYKNY